MEIREYTPTTIEAKWQKKWSEDKAFEVEDNLPREKCYYVLEMFPYPSGKLHMGHVRNYSIGDAVARYKRLRGFSVLHPMGWDSFGLPAEQAAIDRGLHPKGWTYDNIDHMRGQLKSMGFSYAWDREFATSDDEYSRREQELFLDLVEKGLVYRKNSTVNWSTGLNTVLANEQVVDGKCWRTGLPVIQKELPQWFLRTTEYAEELLSEIDNLTQWPDAVKIQQRNWIGKSIGAEIDFPVEGHEENISIFTTRPDTVFGVTFMSLAPEHSLVDKIVTDEQKQVIEDFRKELSEQTEEERTGDKAEKKGVFTGAYAINPVNGNKVPVYAANFVLANYGTGAVMAVPAHDIRDFAFAKKYNIDITKVILENGKNENDELENAFTEVGTMMNSGEFSGMKSDEAKTKIISWLEEKEYGRKKETWRLRDWGISRQRYWGNPIPYVFGEKAGAVALPKKDLPVKLPADVKFDGVGNPIESHPTWATQNEDGTPITIRGKNGKEEVKRETDTMDTFVQSSWYFARYTCPEEEGALDKEKVDHWLPVDLYIGGIEHACMHLLYARFFQKTLADMGHTSVREPFDRVLCQGMVTKETFYREKEDGSKEYFSPDSVDAKKNDKGVVVEATAKEDGKPVLVGRVEKMSKSKNNGIDPAELIGKYGADATRMFALFAAPPEKDLEWDDAGLAGCSRFLKRLWTLVMSQAEKLKAITPEEKLPSELEGKDAAVIKKIHDTVKRATATMEKDFGFNVAIAASMELFNELKPETISNEVMKKAILTLLSILAPFTPHISLELWDELSAEKSLEETGWPSYDEKALEESEIEYPIQIKGKMRGKISFPAGLSKPELEKMALENEFIQKLLDGKQVRKIIAVPNKIINIVV